jgi:long-chain fatty acid transport protein
MFSASLRWTAAGAAAVLLLAPGRTHAAGFAIFEQGARGMGFAGAYTAQAADGSAIFHNAAGIAFLKQRQLYVGGTLIRPTANFTGAEPFPGPNVTEKGDVGLLVPPSAYYTHPFGENVAFGVGLHVPFGLETAWADPDNYSGRYISTRAALKGFSLNPTVAFKLEDRLAVGVGLDVRFSSLELDRRVPVVNPFTQRVVDGAEVHLTSDTNRGYGFNVGVLAKPSETLSIGASYRHKVTVDYSGTASFEPLTTGNADLDVRVRASLPAGAVPLATSIEFPAFASVGFAKAFGDWTFEADVNWYQWKSFDELRLTFETEPRLNETIEEEYANAFQYRFGIERVLNDAWAVRGGYFFDESPSPPASMSPLLPDSNRNGFCLGGSWRSGSLRLDGAAWYVRASERSTDGSNRDRYDGTYKSHALTLGVSMGYSF